jgi:erythromycin esterase
MKRLLAVGLFLIFSNLSGQDFKLIENCTSSIRTINPTDTSFSDLEFLVPILESKRIVLLGEQEHGDGAAFEAKIRLIKFLNKKLGFKIVAFETPFYSTLTTWDKFVKDQANIEEVEKSLVYKHWANSVEMQPLFEIAKTKEIQLAGIDLPFLRKIEKEQYVKSVDSITRNSRIPNNPMFKSILVDLLTKGITFIPEVNDQKIFLNQINTTLSELAERSDYQAIFWRQEFKNLLALGTGWWQKDAHTRKNWWSSGNIRDKQMADNIAWLTTEKYKNQKIIVWAANYHIARNVSSEVMRDKYFENTKAAAMGDYLSELMNDNIYSIGLVSYKGVRSVPEDNFRNIEMKPRTKGSIESFLNTNGFDYSFVNFQSCGIESKFKMAGFFHDELVGNWTRVFDGILFIKQMTPITLRVQK